MAFRIVLVSSRRVGSDLGALAWVGAGHTAGVGGYGRTAGEGGGRAAKAAGSLPECRATRARAVVVCAAVMQVPRASLSRGIALHVRKISFLECMDVCRVVRHC